MKANGYLNIDAGGGGYKDWENGNKHPGDHGGEWGGYKRATSYIPKQKFEEVKFMNGYKVDRYDTKTYNFCLQNCASYSAALYNKHNKHESYGTGPSDPDYSPLNGWCAVPSQIYNALK